MIQGTKIYKVSIEGGCIDNHKSSDYETFPSMVADDLQQSKEKAMALVRFDKLAYDLQKGLDTMCEIITTGHNEKTVATQIDFTLVYTQPDGLWVEVDSQIDGAEQLRDGRFIVKGEKAIEKIIRDSLSKPYQSIVQYWNPKALLNSDEEVRPNANYGGSPYGWADELMDFQKIEPTSITVKEEHELKTSITF